MLTALRELPGRQREVIVLRALLDLDTLIKAGEPVTCTSLPKEDGGSLGTGFGAL
ncbi:MAG TPA: hypothetical protein VHF26_10150 [Trebonia sp.]|nr:hypothetical protein [Trebonia sp.]